MPILVTLKKWTYFSAQFSLSSPLFVPPDLPCPRRGRPGPRDHLEQPGPRPWEGAPALHRRGAHRVERGGERGAALASREYGNGGGRGGPVLGAVHPPSQHRRLGRRGGRGGDVSYTEPAARLDAHWWAGHVFICSALHFLLCRRWFSHCYHREGPNSNPYPYLHSANYNFYHVSLKMFTEVAGGVGVFSAAQQPWMIISQEHYRSTMILYAPLTPPWPHVATCHFDHEGNTLLSRAVVPNLFSLKPPLPVSKTSQAPPTHIH